MHTHRYAYAYIHIQMCTVFAKYKYTYKYSIHIAHYRHTTRLGRVAKIGAKMLSSFEPHVDHSTIPVYDVNGVNGVCIV